MKIVKKQLVSFDVKDIVDGVLIIPKKVTSIADNVILKNNNIIKVVGFGVTSIGNYNFRYCDALTTIELPLVTSIGNDNFRYCDALTTIELPLVTSIGNDNFINCNALTTIELPLVTSIGNYNFYYCNALTTIELPLVTSIGNDNFRYCNALTTIELPLVTSIGNYNFINCNALTTIELPLVTSIGNDNFIYCDALTTIELPLVTSIGNDNFYYCSALTTVEFKNKKLNVKSVDSYLFVIEKTKSTKGIYIHTGYNLYFFDKKTIEKKDCYLAEKDNFFAHGDTIKKAISDVQFKLVAEKIKNEPILPETIITVMYYRIVTGACELGCKDFIERNFLEKEEYRADELLPILEKNNAYGVEKFKSLINW